MKFIIFTCLIAVAAAGIVPSASIAAYSSPLAYSNFSPVPYSNFYNTPYSAYSSPVFRSSFGYSPSFAPLAYSGSPFYRNSYFRSYPYGY